MKWVVTIWEAVTGMSLTYLPRVPANSSGIKVCDHAPLRLGKMRDRKLLTLHWLSFSRWGRYHVGSSFAFQGGQYLSYDYPQPIATQIIQDARPKIVDAPLTLISRIGQGVCLSIFWLYRWPVCPQKQWHTSVNILQLTVGYLTWTINRTSRNAVPEIELDGSWQTYRNPQVNGNSYGFGLTRISGSGFWTGIERIRPVFLIWTVTAGLLPWPIAITTLPSLACISDPYTLHPSTSVSFIVCGWHDVFSAVFSPHGIISVPSPRSCHVSDLSTCCRSIWYVILSQHWSQYDGVAIHPPVWPGPFA